MTTPIPCVRHLLVPNELIRRVTLHDSITLPSPSSLIIAASAALIDCLASRYKWIPLICFCFALTRSLACGEATDMDEVRGCGLVRRDSRHAFISSSCCCLVSPGLCTAFKVAAAALHCSNVMSTAAAKFRTWDGLNFLKDACQAESSLTHLSLCRASSHPFRKARCCALLSSYGNLEARRRREAPTTNSHSQHRVPLPSQRPRVSSLSNKHAMTAETLSKQTIHFLKGIMPGRRINLEL